MATAGLPPTITHPTAAAPLALAPAAAQAAGSATQLSIAGGTEIGGGATSVASALSQVTAKIQGLIDSLRGSSAIGGGPPSKAGAAGSPPPFSPVQVTPTQVAGGTPAKPVHTSLHGTVTAATDTSVTLRDDLGNTRTFAIRPDALDKMDLPHLLEKHVATGKTLDLVYSQENGQLYAHGYSHPPSPPTNPPTPPSKVPHGAIHGTVVSATASSITLKDDNGVDQAFSVAPEDQAQMDLAHLLEKHVPTGKALNLVFTEVNGVKYAKSHNHPDTALLPA